MITDLKNLLTKKKYFLLLWFLVAAIFPGFISGCNSSSQDGTQLPEEVQEAAISVQEAYKFAVANPEIMQSVPCYCGCSASGHTSNYDCYVKEISPDGEITFDLHGLGCSICVDITQDVMHLVEQGSSITEIKTIIDQTFSKYGPSNMIPDSED
jgi:hypothetical protein